MPSVIDPETMNADNLPGIWNPIQWELSEAERIQEVENQARSSLLWVVDISEAILRLLLDETDIERALLPPKGFDPHLQGDWDNELITFNFKRPIHLESVERDHNRLTVTYKFDGLGYWRLEILPERVTIERV